MEHCIASGGTWTRTRPGGGDRRRARRRQVATLDGVQPRPRPGGHARPRERGDALRPRRPPRADHESVALVLRDRGSGRPVDRGPESDGRTGRDRRGPARDTTGVAGIAQRAGRRQRMARAGRLSAAPADPRCGQAPAVSRSRRRPVVVVVDDVQWVDPETQALLDALVDTLPAARVMLLVAYRPEYQHAWANRASYTQLRLDRLSPSSVETLFDSLVGTDSSLAPLKEYLIERTEGNPFFLEECVRSFVETGVLVGPRGARRRALEMDGIPCRCRTRSRRSSPRASTGSRPSTSACCSRRRSSGGRCPSRSSRQ